MALLLLCGDCEVKVRPSAIYQNILTNVFAAQVVFRGAVTGSKDQIPRRAQVCRRIETPAGTIHHHPWAEDAAHAVKRSSGTVVLVGLNGSWSNPCGRGLGSRSCSIAGRKPCTNRRCSFLS